MRQELASILHIVVCELTGYQTVCGLLRSPVVFVCKNQKNVHLLYGLVLEGTSEQSKAFQIWQELGKINKLIFHKNTLKIESANISANYYY